MVLHMYTMDTCVCEFLGKWVLKRIYNVSFSLCLSVILCVCVCVCEREREREALQNEGGGGGTKQSEVSKWGNLREPFKGSTFCPLTLSRSLTCSVKYEVVFLSSFLSFFPSFSVLFSGFIGFR